MRFTGLKILVVGAATGMGRAVAEQLLKEGADVVAFDLRSADLNELAADHPDSPLAIMAGDITQSDHRRALVESLKSTLDGLVYAAGTLDGMVPAHDVDDELWDYVMEVNVNSFFRLIRDTAPLMWDHSGRAASIVVIGSVGGLYGSTAGPAYITSKHAVLGLVRNLAWTYRNRNIRVNAINPGSVMTSILENFMEKWPQRDLVHPEGGQLFTVESAVSLGQGIMGEPEDVARAVCFLLSEESSYISGAQLTVDGGWTSF